MPLIRVGVSSCLLGEPVRYDGGHKHDHYITDTLGSFFELVPVCPEKESGMPVPREAMRLVGDPAAPRLVTIASGLDLTASMVTFCQTKLEDLVCAGLCGFIVKSKSPSCGLHDLAIFSVSGETLPVAGRGLFAAVLLERLPRLPVVDEVDLYDTERRKAFLQQVLAYHYELR